jgi:hypothetical protein
MKFSIPIQNPNQTNLNSNFSSLVSRSNEVYFLTRGIYLSIIPDQQNFLQILHVQFCTSINFQLKPCSFIIKFSAALQLPLYTLIRLGVSVKNLKGYDAGFPKKLQIFYKCLLWKKKIRGGSLCTRGVAGIWAVDLFSHHLFWWNNYFCGQ